MRAWDIRGRLPGMDLLLPHVRCALAESPRWDERLQRLYWVDINAGVLHRCAENGSDHRTWEVGAPLGNVALTNDPAWVLISVGLSVSAFDLDHGTRRELCRLETSAPVRINDGGVDPAGRLWFGTTRLDYGWQGGGLYRLDGDGTCRQVLDRVSISNGLAWHGESMYYADSPLGRVDRFDWDAASGAITARQTIAVTKPVLPDGMAIDCEGMLWVALFPAGQVQRIDPADGRILAIHPIPVTLSTACCLGGVDGDLLFITSAQDHGDLPRSTDPTLSGAVFRTRLSQSLATTTHRFFPAPMKPQAQPMSTHFTPVPWKLYDRLEDIPFIAPRVIDARKQRLPTSEDADAFMECGAIVIENFLDSEEVARWRSEIDPLLELALAKTPTRLPGEDDDALMKRISSAENCFSDNPPGAPDTWYGIHKGTGKIVPRLIDFNLDKSRSCRIALANPFLMTFAELVMGKDFLQMFEATIVKSEGAGFVVDWHRDRHEPFADDPRWPTIVPGIYLDDSDASNAVRFVPGSHRLTPEASIRYRNQCANDGYDAPYMMSVPVKAGTMVIHHAHALHGSPEGVGGLRRVQYLGMRSVRAAQDKWDDALIRACHRRHLLCIGERMGDPRYRGEVPYHYRADVSRCEDNGEWQKLPLFRIPQQQHSLPVPRHELAKRQG